MAITCNDNEDEILVAEEIHAEIMDVITVRRVNPDATTGDQIDIPVHEEPETALSTVFCMLILLTILLPPLVNCHQFNDIQPYDQTDQATFIQEEIPTPCSITSSQASASEQNQIDAKENVPIAGGVNLDIEADIHDSSDADKDVPTIADVNLATDIDIRLAQPDLSSQEDLSATASQPLAATDSQATAAPEEQGEIQQALNQSHFEGASPLESITIESSKSVNGPGTSHAVDPPPDRSAVSNSSVREVVIIAVAAGGEVNTRKGKMKKETNSQDNTKSDANPSEMASSSGMDKEQHNHTMAIKDENKEMEDDHDIDRSRPTDLGKEDAPALSYSQKKGMTLPGNVLCASVKC